MTLVPAIVMEWPRRTDPRLDRPGAPPPMTRWCRQVQPSEDFCRVLRWLVAERGAEPDITWSVEMQVNVTGGRAAVDVD